MTKRAGPMVFATVVPIQGAESVRYEMVVELNPLVEHVVKCLIGWGIWQLVLVGVARP